MTSSDTVRVAPRLILGLGILTFGILWMIDNLNVFDAGAIRQWWPVILIAIGAVRLLDRTKSRAGSVILIVIGTLFVLDVADLIEFDSDDLVPLLIVAIGAKLVWDAFDRRGKRAQAIGEPGSHLSAFAFMAGVKRQSNAMAFHSADANAIMGGVEIDLRNANMKPGEEAVIDTFAWWGGIEITVPEHWRVESTVLPLMGAYEDNTKATNAAGPVLVVRGLAVMGAVEVKN
ncbi:MAG TPA: DUF5668 domain-containing protein [Thermoanaerobaculia bacterium]|nr:DUF5668 domain-containing protein [Thermoanaerobaculia bacterium]